MTYGAAIEWLYGTQLFGIKLGLDNVRRLLRELGLLERLAGRKIIHVAGTNGKGSVCAMAEAILRVEGLRTGLFTSPHLVTFRERIRVNGEMIPEAEVAVGLTEIGERVVDWDPHPTFFEITLALAVQHFCEADCEVLILETGMGGRLDATNALESDVAVITPIGLDHTEWLGETLTAVAGEKAGIIKSGKPVLSARQAPEAAAMIESEARLKQSSLHWVGPVETQDLPVALAGAHQRANAALAVAAAREIVPDLSEDSITRGLARVEWPARFQRIGERFVIDGAHNADAAEALAETWRSELGESVETTIIFGGVAEKDTEAVMRCLAPIASRWIFTRVASHRGISVDDLERTWQELGIKAIPIERAESAAIALQKTGGDGLVLITGSLYLAGEALAELQGGAAFEVSEQ